MGALAGLAALLVAAAAFTATFALTRRRNDAPPVRLNAIASPGSGRLAAAYEGPALRRTPGAFDRRVGHMPLAASLRRDIQRAGLSWQLRDYVGLIAIAMVLPGLLAFVLTGIAAAA